MSENIEKFGKPGDKKRGKLLQAMPGIITIIHAGLPHHTPVEIDLLSPKAHECLQFNVAKDTSHVIDLYSMIIDRQHSYTYEIGVLQIICADSAQGNQHLCYYKNDLIETQPKILIPHEPQAIRHKKTENLTIVNDSFIIGGTQKLLYRIGIGKEVQLLFWPSSRTKVVDNG